MKNIKNNLVAVVTFLTGVVGHHYVSKLLDFKDVMAAAKEVELRDVAAQENMGVLHEKLDVLNKNSESLIDPLTKLANKHVPEAELTAINHKLDYEVKQCKTVKAILDKEPENLDLDFYRAAYRATDACERAFQNANDAIKALVIL
jgi:hypothetical protein